MTKSVLLATHPFGRSTPDPRALLREAGATLVENPVGRKLTGEELRELLPGVQAVIASTEPYTAEVLEGATELELIARTGIGLDSVDLEACRARGVAVTYTPDAPSDSVAELTVGLAVALAREVLPADRAVRGGGWERRVGWLLRERTVGILGFGRCGRRVARLLAPFGARLLAHDVDPEACAAARAEGVEVVDAEALVARSELLTLHVPLTEATEGWLNAARLAALPRGAKVINTARGEVVDEDALLEALRSRQVSGAALDVFGEEPYRGPLADRPEVILTCHMGSCSDAGRVAMERGAVEATLAWLRGEELPRRVV